MEDIRWLKDQGCKLQINLYSLAGDINKERRDLTRKMIKERMVDFLGTDAHRMSHRPPRIASGMKVLNEIADPEYVREISYQNAERFLKMKLMK